MNTLKSGLLLLFLMMLAACSSSQNARVEYRTVTVTERVYLTPPSDMLQPCIPTERFSVITNADGIGYSAWLESLLSECDSKIYQIRTWSADQGGQ